VAKKKKRDKKLMKRLIKGKKLTLKKKRKALEKGQNSIDIENGFNTRLKPS